LLKETRKKNKIVLPEWDKVNKQNMRTKCPMQLVHLTKEEDYQYTPRLDIKLHPKNAWQSLENPLAHPKCINHLWPKCSNEESICLKKLLMDFKVYILTLSPTRANWVERWSKAKTTSLTAPMMWVLFTRDGKTQLGALVMVSKNVL